MRVLFMGTPAYAVPALEAVASRHEIVGVVTRVDKPNRRGNKIAFSPVKEWALAHEVPIFQPESMRDPALAGELAALAPDVGVVVAFGMMIPEEIANLPRFSSSPVPRGGPDAVLGTERGPGGRCVYYVHYAGTGCGGRDSIAVAGCRRG